MRPGTYRIENVASRSLVRSYSQETPLFVSNTLEYPGPFALVNIPKIILPVHPYSALLSLVRYRTCPKHRWLHYQERRIE